MKLFKKLAAGASALAMAATMAASGLASALPVTAVDDCNDDWLHAEGSKLYDKDGNQVWLTGANWFGMNCEENFPHGLWSADVDVLLSSVADRGINVIRFPISVELLLSWKEGTPYPAKINAKKSDGYSFNPDFCHDDGTEMNSMEVFDVIMQKCKKYGIKAFIDVHSPASHNSGHNYNLWYYEATADDCDNMATIKEDNGLKTGAPVTWEQWIESITWLAEKYANDDTLIAYDLKNEPHGKRGYTGTTCPANMAKWDDSTDQNNWKYSAEECAKSILKVNPNALILIEGIEQYPKEGYTFDTPDVWEPKTEADKKWYGAWWGGNLRGVKDHPVDLGSDQWNAQIVYSPHDYGPSVYAQTWFAKEFTTETLLDDYWRDTWAYINEDDIAPLLIGEWGGHMAGADELSQKNQHWMELLRDYMIDNHINHTFWCLNPNSGDTGGLLNATFSEWDDEKYALFEKSLWQTNTTGKYIGLDHQHPLGLNGTGLSLTEYYSTYDKSEGSNINGGKGTSKSDPVELETKEPTPSETPTEKPTEKPTDAPTEDPTGLVPIPPTEEPTEQPTEQPGSDIMYGDINDDKTIDIMDVIALNKFLLGSSTLDDAAKARADVDLSKQIDSTDSLIVLKRVVEIIDTLPAVE